MYTHHRFDHEFPPGTEVTCSYVVCSVPRSGSSLLCELLCLSGVAGAPTEYLDAEQRDRFCESWGAADLDGYVAMLLDKKTSPNGVFGLKTHFDQMAATLGDRDLFDVFGDLRTVYIRRADHLGQAISYAIAIQSNQWASTHDATGPVAFDRAQITRLLDQIERDEQRWEEWFTAHGVAPLRIEYADLVADPIGTTAAVLHHLGIESADHLDGLTPTLQRQADGRSRRWALRYRCRPGSLRR